MSWGYERELATDSKGFIAREEKGERRKRMAVKPEDFMEQSLNKKVVLTIKTGRRYVGTLRSYDEYNNVYLEDVEDEESKQKLGASVFKGGNLTDIQRYSKKTSP